MREIRKSNICYKCGENDPVLLTFHHKDGYKKIASVSRLYRKGIDIMKEELDKCIILCHNCHMILHGEKKRNNGEIY